VIDILVQPHRDQCAAERFFRKHLRGQGAEPLRIITDKMRSDRGLSKIENPQRSGSQCPSTAQVDNAKTVAQLR
jgi:transposase-like protein